MKIWLRVFKRLFNGHTVKPFAIFYSIWLLLLTLYYINVQLPNPAVASKALSVMIIISLIIDFVAIAIKAVEIAKQWKAEGFTFSFRLADDIEDDEEL